MLEHFLVSQIFALFMVFCRVGSAVMVLPGIGEAYVSPRIRLFLALAISLIIMPLTLKIMPPVPASPISVAIMLSGEIAIGLIFGFISRLIISGLHVAGMIIAAQSGLSTASMFDINQASQGSVIGNFLSLTAVLLIFSLDLHHLMLKGVVDSYSLFPPATVPPMEDVANLASSQLTKSFEVALMLSAPHIVVGLMIYLGAGILSRLMPMLQIFFLIMAPQIMISFFILMVMLTSIMNWYMVYFEESLQKFISGSGY